jgi:alpha-L-arabinofuranosidase
MDLTKILFDREYQIGPVDPRLFGGFLEHIGRAVYQGVYEPGLKLADENGFRKDVLSSLKKLHFTAMRYPGGNFASGYHWMDGIGPCSSRPTILELASKSIEPNRFGTDEFIHLARMMDWTPMFTANLGTGTPEEASNWVQYCNSVAGTKFADMRVKNGFSAPHNIKLWCLGNEMDGPWQIGHMPAEQYAIQARQAAKMMKYSDPSIELVVCGSAEMGLPTYMQWDRAVLEFVGDEADYLSLHQYVGKGKGDTADYLAVTNSIDQHIEEMDALCRTIQGRLRSKKRYYLAFDEWNVWYRTQDAEHVDGHGKFAQHLVEEEYNLEDALVVAGFLNSFIRHADVVKIANLAQIVNVLAPILTRDDQILLQAIYYSILVFAGRCNGTSLRPVVHGPGYESPTYGFVQMVDTSAILGDSELHVFLTNRSQGETATIEIKTPGLRLKSVRSAEIVTGLSAMAGNTFEIPDVVCNQKFTKVQVNGESASAQLPPLSVVAITFDTSM